MDISVWLTLCAIPALIAASAFFSGVETALTAVSRGRIHKMAREGNWRAQRTEHLRKKKEKLIGSLLLANNLANIFASVLATSALISLFGQAGVLYATLLMTAMIVIFAEILPKIYALHHPLRLSLGTAPIIHVLIIVLTPLTTALQVIVLAILRLFRAGPQGESRTAREEELRGIIELHARSGMEERQERAMLRSILDLDDVEVDEIMVHRREVFTLNANLDPVQFVRKAMRCPHTRIPLWQNSPDNIIGVLHVRSLLPMLQGMKPIRRQDIIAATAKPWFIPETTSLLKQLQSFRRRREHFAMVVDEYGALIGIVTLEDILEEIVGDIADEFDRSTSNIHPQPDQSVIVSGDVTLRDLNRRFDWSLPDEEAATIAGLIIHEARTLPEEGHMFRFKNFTFSVLSRKKNQVTQVRIQRRETRRTYTEPRSQR